MVKSVFKEIIIILLLILAILILLAILFYDNMPTSKTVPTKVETYALDAETSAEIRENLDNNSEEIIKTYQLDAIVLEHYEKTKEYNKGKVNPFADYYAQTNNNNNNNSNGNGNGSSNSSSNDSTSNSSSNNNTNTSQDENIENTTTNESQGTFLNVVGK